MTIEIITTILKTAIASALFFVWVVRYKNIVREFEEDFNYPSWLRDLTGIIKLTCAALLFYPEQQLQNIGLLGIVTLMVFAILTHIRIKNTLRKTIPAVALISLCLLLLFFNG